MRRFLWIPLLLAAGCALPPREEVPPPRPPVAPPAAEAPAETWNVVASHLEVRLYRDGPMQKLGHNHLVASDALAGEIRLREPLTASGFELRLALETLVVDDDALRARAGPDFAAPVPHRDREATRDNMLGDRLLAAAQHPEMRLTAESLSGEPGRYEARVRVALAGAEHVIAAPFAVAIDGDRLEARSTFRLTHGDVGLVPFAAALGALKVRDDFEVDLTLEARRGT